MDRMRPPASQYNRPANSVDAPPMDRKSIDAALSHVYAVWNAGLWISLERGHPSIQQSPHQPFAMPKERTRLERDTASLSTPLTELLSANRKEWAERRDEFALAPHFDGAGNLSVGLVLLEKRRAIGPGALINSPADLPHRFKQCNGIILPVGLREKEQIAWWLREAGMLRPDVLVIEVPETAGEDYRDVISGSHWLRSNARPLDNQLVAKALLTAMQARSFRKDAIRAGKTSWWQALAAARYARINHLSATDACRQLDCISPEIVNWTERALQWKPKPEHGASLPAKQAPAANQSENSPTIDSGTNLPATDRQKSAGRSLVAEFPQLGALFLDGWDSDRRKASHILGHAMAAAEKMRSARDQFQREAAAALAEAQAALAR